MENTQLVPTFAGEDGTPTCNARDLHRVLEVGRDFSTWFKDRIAEYGFEDGVDFVRVNPGNASKLDSPNLGNQDSASWGGDRRSIDYHLTVNMAKELAMLENNDIGRKVRRYFIRVEQEALHGNSEIILEMQAKIDYLSSNLNAWTEECSNRDLNYLDRGYNEMRRYTQKRAGDAEKDVLKALRLLSRMHKKDRIYGSDVAAVEAQLESTIEFFEWAMTPPSTCGFSEYPPELWPKSVRLRHGLPAKPISMQNKAKLKHNA